ncbi:MAG: transcriptional regulator [Clostridiales bacterium GWF2_38_85]|nr:MAG: transcriptional regulator [Clostridiales bacterium GWF2_38_85]HBL85136.1 transcriptional regulator [Clostridiales bacterium]
MNNTDLTLVMKALSDVTRLKIIEMVSEGELCACKILESFNITQPTLSYHMKILCDCGLVDSRRDGAWIRYNLNKQTLELVSSYFNRLKTQSYEFKIECLTCE